MTDTRSPPLPLDEIVKIGAIVRNALLARAGVATLADSLTWAELTETFRIRAAQPAALPQLARERRALRNFRAAADAAADSLTEQVRSVFYCEPLVSASLVALAAAREPAFDAELGRILARAGYAPATASPENLDIWLTEPLARPETARAGKHTPLPASTIRTLRDRFRGARDPLDIIFAETIDDQSDLVTSVLIEAAWATGLRPVEWLSASMSVDTPDGRMDLTELYKSALKGSPVPPGIDRLGRLRHLKALLGTQVDSGPAWLRVRNAKAQWFRQHGLPARRSIGLRAYPQSTRIAVYCAAFAARRIGAGQWDKWRRRVNRRLKGRAADLSPDGVPITLYAFRHDFIERAKAALPPEEVAALAGHCSTASKGYYGRPRLRGRAARAAAPAEPDPDLVRILRDHFEQRRRPRPESGPYPSPSPSPGG